MEQDSVSGIVFDIERFSTHDGPGIRTVVFLKGCPLHCMWCASPESQSPMPQMGFLSELCAACDRCVGICPGGSYFLRRKQPDFSGCEACFRCVETCLYHARVRYGVRMYAEEVVKKVKEDALFYKKSRGGVTLSGGEVSLQPQFAAAVLKKCRLEGIHTAIETCGFAEWERFHSVIQHVDYLMYDLKHMDSEIHRRYTGVGNEQILQNAKKASFVVSEMVVRMPVIPGVNDSIENAEKMGTFIREELHGVKRVDLLPYHSVGASKGSRIGKKYDFQPPYEIDEGRLALLRSTLKGFGLDVKIEA